jgi:hypothetical protein
MVLLVAGECQGKEKLERLFEKTYRDANIKLYSKKSLSFLEKIKKTRLTRCDYIKILDSMDPLIKEIDNETKDLIRNSEKIPVSNFNYQNELIITMFNLFSLDVESLGEVHKTFEIRVQFET